MDLANWDESDGNERGSKEGEGGGGGEEERKDALSSPLQNTKVGN